MSISKLVPLLADYFQQRHYTSVVCRSKRQDATKVPCIMPFLFITDDGFYGYRSEGIAIHDVHARSRGSSAGAYFFVSVLSYRRRSAFCRQPANVISNASEFPCFYRTNLSLSSYNVGQGWLCRVGKHKLGGRGCIEQLGHLSCI